MEVGAAPWKIMGPMLRGYVIRVDQLAPWNGHATWHLARAGAPVNDHVWMVRSVASAPYAGARVRIDVDVYTQGPPGQYSLWAHVRMADGSSIGADTPIEPVAAFRHASLVLDVPPGAETIELGPGVTSPAELWVAESSISVVDASVPVTPPSTL
jgi:hypothetical protein